MARKAPTSPVSSKMYQHFAVVTVAITACLAVFADGEEKEAFQEQIAQRQALNELKAEEQKLAEQGKGGNAGMSFKDNRQSGGSFGSDGVMNVPVNYSAGASGSQYEGGVNVEGPMAMQGIEGSTSMDDALPPDLSPAARKDFERELRRRRKNAQPDSETIERMIEASKERSQTQSLF